MNTLLERVRRALEARWNARLPDILNQAQRLRFQDPKQIYIQAWRDAYASAIEDMVDAGLVVSPKEPITGKGPTTNPLHGVH